MLLYCSVFGNLLVSAVEAGDAEIFLGKIEAKFKQKWLDSGEIKIVHPQNLWSTTMLLVQWRSKWGRISTLFAVTNAFKAEIYTKVYVKMHIFWKNVKIVLASEASPPNPHLPPAAEGSAPKPLLLLPHTITVLLSSFLSLITFYYPKKRTK